jgi:prevent-host-death family protein
MGSMHDTNHKGNVAEAAIAAEAIKLGVPVLRPMVEHTRYDLIFDIGSRLFRVQCKWASREKDIVIVRLRGHRLTTQGSVRTTYSADEIDAVVAYCEELNEFYWLPIDLVAGVGAIQLRLEPPRNGQRAAIHWAADHLLSGAIAQLGERLTGSQEVGGSSPPGSTDSPTLHVPINECRRRFGWYMERATAGEEFLVTRRGKPYVRLLPAHEQLALESEADAGSRPLDSADNLTG